MAKLQETVLVVKVSKLFRDSDEITPLISDTNIKELEAVIQELAAPGSLVEIEHN